MFSVQRADCWLWSVDKQSVIRGYYLMLTGIMYSNSPSNLYLMVLEIGFQLSRQLQFSLHHILPIMTQAFFWKLWNVLFVLSSSAGNLGIHSFVPLVLSSFINLDSSLSFIL